MKLGMALIKVISWRGYTYSFFALEVIGIRSWELRVIGIVDYGLCVIVIEY